MSARLSCGLIGLVLVLVLVPVTQARADLFGPISLASEGALSGQSPQQAEYAHDAVVSGDGRYIAFDGAVGGVTGVWRRDLATGSLEEVAGGDAELPSISQTGRYISFTTTVDILPADEALGPNVWVRDMEPGPSQPMYLLASALSGSQTALTYAYGSSPAREAKQFGSSAAGRSAISADGNEVAFVTTAVSNLAGPSTPPLQVAVRDFASEQTTLVSGEYEAAGARTTDTPVSGGEGLGAVYPGSAQELGFRPVPADGNWAADPPVGASISADGSTVAWMGEDVERQVPVLGGERLSALYTEPLWRRIEPGSQTPTERVTGGSDPGSPACRASGEQSLPAVQDQFASDPCQGPFRVQTVAQSGGSRGIWSETGGGGEADFVPRLSADGGRVAFISSAVPMALGAGFAAEPEGEPSDLYVVDMSAGLTRNQAIVSLTRIGGENVAADSPITDFQISADGEQVAFSTRRSELTLGSPAYVSAPLGEPGESELFDVDLADDTLTRVTHGYGGEPSEQPHESVLDCPAAEDPYCNPITIGAQSPSFSASGDLLAFSSTASNLVYGDGNGPRRPNGKAEGEVDGSDAFVVGRERPAALPTPQILSPAPGPSPRPAWQLDVSAFSRSDGAVVLYVLVPGAGRLSVNASALVPVTGPAQGVSGRRAARGRTRVGGARVAVRTVARASALAAGGRLLRLVLVPAGRYAGLDTHVGGLSAKVALSFAAAGHPAVHQSVAVAFEQTKRAADSARRRASRKRRRR